MPLRMRYDIILSRNYLGMLDNQNKNVLGSVIFNSIVKGGGNTGATYNINSTA